ncbi:hypothetical protein FE374_15090 [Georgenia yuyongxinii]|uniref:Type VII secretion protein EccE n=1 Tax=Georgenia yuyongxinii TaxID=2589797 RepID=A0A5B8C4R2_9MICO|nr:SCO6880 family protein [Georgenia yuyongxinii]QDC25759.1 hypothetical protein FE374_15090 [Georgenia yuyongxinii]
MSRTSILGGESGHRSFFGGSVPHSRLIALLVAAIAAMILTITLGTAGFAVGAAVVLVAWLVSSPTVHGSLLERWVARRRWRERLRTGTAAFAPFDQARWDELTARRPGRRAAAQQAHALRERPDGAEGMGWLDLRPGRPGIAWHTPTGEDPYLSVVFEVSGQIRGIESEHAVEAGQVAWGAFLASLGSEESIARTVQSLTRVLPPDSAGHEAWVVSQVDGEAPDELLRSYDDLLHRMGRREMAQRHYVAVRWPLTPAFHRAAERYGPGRDGWRRLMVDEVDALTRGLRRARMGHVRPLTAREVAAVILHMQNPSRPIDQLDDVDPETLGLPSVDDYSAHVVHDVDPFTDEPVEWWHRTAVITARAMATGERTSLWMTPLLSGMPERIVRTLSLQTWMVPAREAKATARIDATSDHSELLRRRDAGRLLDDESEVSLTAAQRRLEDLRPGTQHHGAEWLGHLTVSARSRDELAQAVRLISATAERGLGIERLDWLDTYQSAASGCTWPIVRGMRPPAPSAAQRVMRTLSGHGAREAL